MRKEGAQHNNTTELEIRHSTHLKDENNKNINFILSLNGRKLRGLVIWTRCCHGLHIWLRWSRDRNLISGALVFVYGTYF